MDDIHKKIKLIRCTLGEFIKTKTNFGKLDKGLKDSEVFLNLQIAELSDEFKKVKELHVEVSTTADEEDEIFLLYQRENVFQAIQNVYYKHVTNLHELLKIVTASEKCDVTFNEFTQAAFYRANSGANGYHGNPDLSLSMINASIEPFDGSYHKWADFKDAFRANIHENQHLNEGAKLRILQSVLRGDAQKLIKREFGTVKASDYEEVWNKLNRRYNHKRTLVNSYFSVLFYQPNIEKETAESLKKLYDTTFDTLLDLKKLELQTDLWGDILLFLIHSKLPLKTKELWDERISRNETLPKFNKFMEFLELRFRTLESLDITRKSQNSFQPNGNKPTVKKVSSFQTTKESSNFQHTKESSKTINKAAGRPRRTNTVCRVCEKGTHKIRNCDKFLKLNCWDRREAIRTLGYCFNCFSYSHIISECISEGRCSTCGEKHHTLLHLPDRTQNTGGENPHVKEQEFVNIPSTCDGRFSNGHNNASTLLCESESSVIFPTALVKISSPSGHSIVLRAIIDACSDVSYISKEAADRLTLAYTSTLIQVRGVGDVLTTESRSVASFKLQSLINSEFSEIIQAHVLPKISSDRPVHNFTVKCSPLHSIQLADPYYNIKSKIDLLLGGSLDALIRLPGLVKSKFENINYQQTTLGWIASGTIPTSNCFLTTQQSNISLRSLDVTIRQFWELEEVQHKRMLTKEEELCEQIYDNTTIRSDSGKYSVSLPFKLEVRGFKNMRRTALRRFASLEKRFGSDRVLKCEYAKCLNEYIQLGHMREVDPQDFPDAYYIPHHCVIKESSSTTKFRVVFDASAKDANLQSLNDCILKGPRIQADLLDLLIRFRYFRVAFTADIEKMYRQVWINPNDHKFQLIVWRDDENKPIKTFSMNTVTFGTTSAPYLAIKTLSRLAEDEKSRFPLGALCLQNGFYVDDCIYGSDTMEEALETQKQVLSILSSAGFHLRKWASNTVQLLKDIPDSDQEKTTVLDFDAKSSIKTLGIQWSPISDCFLFKICLIEHSKYTKRTVLSDIAKIFDPMGLLSPCLVSAKLLIQDLWLENQLWDEELSEKNMLVWKDLREGFMKLETVSIPRWLHTTTQCKLEIHGFSDASQKAYAAAIYIKAVTVENKVEVSLLFSKTKVAPLKQVSLPRLELMGALLLAKMMDHLRHTFEFPNTKVFYWCDSEITLAWIKDEPHKRKVFVANRITEIQSISDPLDWHYVKTSENPADLGTRGICPSILPDLSLWWHGPEFLRETNNYTSHSVDNISLPVEDDAKPNKRKDNPFFQTFLTERRPHLMEISSNVMRFTDELLNKYSTLSKLVRVVGYCLRFLKRNRTTSLQISPTEYENSLLAIIKIVQQEVYSDEIESLQNDCCINKQSSLYSLNPIICSSDGLLRVSGRLAKASHLNFDQKFPIILPRSHTLSLLIVRHAHLATLHGTNQETAMLIAQRYHIIKCKHIVRVVTNKCVKCFKLRCRAQKQLMGLLPQYRVTPNRPFLNCGVDFAGPFHLKKFRGKCSQFTKSYFAIFICFATKAIHLEVVVDLSTSAFIASYRRFTSRRGLVRNLHSDCGTNFIGAKKPITRSNSEVRDQWNADMANELAQFNTTWHFNPPASPHFGGLWEAGVKSVKYHLKRVVGETHLTYDEFETILVQIEAILNSRPLCPVLEDPNHLVLTPAHFLIQDSLLSLPDDNLESAKVCLHDRWRMIQKLVQSFWKLWSEDYLNTLRQRKKWKHCQSNIKINDVVIVRENNLPPNAWVLGLVTDVHPGPDGLIRVVTLKSKNKLYQRPVVKLSPLPI